jgi:hypothetical protein
VLGKRKSKKGTKMPKSVGKGKVKGPRPVMEEDEDDDEDENAIMKKGKLKKNGKSSCA